MKQTNASQAAFPGTWEEEHEAGHRSYKVTMHTEGMSLLEYYAGIALQGLLACPAELNLTPENAAGKSLRYAKALIEELRNNFREEQEAIRKAQEQYRLDHPDEDEEVI